MFLQKAKIPIVGITGTNGKSTTTALLNHVLSKKYKTIMGGNIGVAVSDLRIDETDNTIAVLELSSYQLERMPSWGQSNHTGVLTNITSDHLSRHGGINGYIDAKSNILRAPSVFMALDDSITKGLYGGLSKLDRNVYGFETNANTFEKFAKITHMQGIHNYQNMNLCYEVARSFGMDAKEIIDAIASFPGLPHRQEMIGRANQVVFINDSKATNPESTYHALAAYENIYWILGGQAKESMLDGLEIFYNKIKKAYTFGQASMDFARLLIKSDAFNSDKILQRKLLSEVVCLAYQDALKDGGGVVLLSPACASWDQYKNFEHRGNHFRELVNEIIGEGNSIDSI